MVRFCEDRDILKLESGLFTVDIGGGKEIVSGVGELDGTSFIDSGSDFVSAGVESGYVIRLRSSGGEVDGAFEVVSVISDVELLVSVLRGSVEDVAFMSGQFDGVCYSVVTYREQCSETGFMLTEVFGLRPGRADGEYGSEEITDAEVLRSLSLYGVLCLIYAGLMGKMGDVYYLKAKRYGELFSKARERVRVGIDTDGDGESEVEICGGSVRLRRC